MKHYADRDITSEEMMQPYMNHVNAMTGEELHSKSDIAAELAYRDVLICDLYEALENVNLLIAEGASEGFNPLKNDWAERLFFSQQKTHDALRKIRDMTL